MKLLILTQKVDKNDSVLGFFHNWIYTMASKFDSISVICLEKGECVLPRNVNVYSLGKESGKSRIKYIKNLFAYTLGLYNQYDTVFVHMNEEYVLLAGLIWKLLRKKVYFWRNHPKGSVLTRLAVMLSDKVFYTSPDSYTARFKKSILMPVGIDTNIFRSEIRSTKFETKNNILSLGRISPIKNIDKMLETVRVLDQQSLDFVFDIVGQPVNKEDFLYFENLKKKFSDLIKKGKVNFLGPTTNSEALTVYNQHKIFLNLTPSGSMDKTILEATSCGCIPVVANTFFKEIFDPNMIVQENIFDISNKLKFWLEADEKDARQTLERLKKYVLENHSLNALIGRLNREIKQYNE